MDGNTCGNCGHFIKFGNEPRGYCFLNPPTVFPSGGMGRPLVKENERACGHWQAGTPAIKEKVQPATPGDAIKAARQERRQVVQTRR